LETIEYIERSIMKSIIYSTERGQALILIAFAAIALFAITGLAIDGSHQYSDRRHAQNAADTAALAGSLSLLRDHTGVVSGSAQQWQVDALSRAASNGYDRDLVTNRVWVYRCSDSPTDVNSLRYESPVDCGPYEGMANYIEVVITSNINTTFSRVIGIHQTHNTVHAIALAQSGYNGPGFNGNALVSLVQSGNGYDAHGTPVWTITGGGIFVNSPSLSAATCGGNAGVISPSITTVGGTNLTCHTVNVSTITTGAPQYSYANYSRWFPRQPACNGTASISGGQWRPQSGADGSNVEFSGDMDFAPGLYCVTNSPGPFHGHITGSGVTFYVMSSNFKMKFDGKGDLTASAPTSGEYQGVLMYLAPQVDADGNLLRTQEMDMRGNGTGDITGTVIAPSASVTMFGNSGTLYYSQVIANKIDSGGNADISVTYRQGDNWIVNLPPQTGIIQ
jgi:hypothetical protein